MLRIPHVPCCSLVGGQRRGMRGRSASPLPVDFAQHCSASYASHLAVCAYLYSLDYVLLQWWRGGMLGPRVAAAGGSAPAGILPTRRIWQPPWCDMNHYRKLPADTQIDRAHKMTYWSEPVNIGLAPPFYWRAARLTALTNRSRKFHLLSGTAFKGPRALEDAAAEDNVRPPRFRSRRVDAFSRQVEIGARWAGEARHRVRVEPCRRRRRLPPLRCLVLPAIPVASHCLP